jgi:hypothetical protein
MARGLRIFTVVSTADALDGNHGTEKMLDQGFGEV